MQAETTHLWLFVLTNKWNSAIRTVRETWWKIRYWKMRRKFISRVNHVPSDVAKKFWNRAVTLDNTPAPGEGVTILPLMRTEIAPPTPPLQLSPEEIKFHQEMTEALRIQQEELRKVREEYAAKQSN